MMKKTSENLPGWILPAGALFCCALWGSAPPMIKMGYEALQISGTGSILVFAGIRFFLAGLLSLLLGRVLHTFTFQLDKGLLGPVLVLAFFQTAGQYYFYYMGLAHTSAVAGAILSGCSAFFSLLVAALLFHMEKLTGWKILGCILGFLGILVMNLDDFSFQFSIQGEGFLLMSQVCSAFSAVFLKKFSSRWNPVLLSGAQFVVGGLILWLLGWSMQGQLVWNLSGILILLWLGFVSAAAYSLWGILLSRFPVSAVGIYGCTIPLFGVLLSWLFMRDQQALSWQTLCALVCVSVGVWMLNRPQKNHPQSDAA